MCYLPQPFPIGHHSLARRHLLSLLWPSGVLWEAPTSGLGLPPEFSSECLIAASLSCSEQMALGPHKHRSSCSVTQTCFNLLNYRSFSFLWSQIQTSRNEECLPVETLHLRGLVEHQVIVMDTVLVSGFHPPPSSFVFVLFVCLLF